MISATRLLSLTIGRVVPRYRTCAQWAVEYEQIVALRPLSAKTLANRRSALRHVVAHLGGVALGGVRPVMVGRMVAAIAARSPQTAKRVLFETRDFFNEAVLAGVLFSNPATPIRPPRVRVQRNRLTLPQWRAIRVWADQHQPPWVRRMLDLALITGQRRSDLVRMGPAHVRDGYLHVVQAKTGARLRLPLSLQLSIAGRSLGDVITDCSSYAAPGETFLRRSSGRPLVCASLSARFEEAREGAGLGWQGGAPPSLHECRSLAERLYREQGVDTRVLLGHRHQSMTDIYNDDRGLTAGEWQTLAGC